MADDVRTADTGIAEAPASPRLDNRRLWTGVGIAMVAWLAAFLLKELVTFTLFRLPQLDKLPGGTLFCQTCRATYQEHTVWSRLSESVWFFTFETQKVLLLLVGVVFLMGLVRSFFTPERTRALLAGRRESVGNIMAAGLGVLTPFCSCSAVPMFIGFVTAGVPLGVTFSFLIAAPLINEVALGLLFAQFGWRVGVLYLGTGLSIAILAGWIIGRLQLERLVEPWVYAIHAQQADADTPRLSWAERVRQAGASVGEIIGKVWPYVLVAIAVGAGIHGYVPERALAGIMGSGAWWSVPLAVVLGVPMYSNAAGIVPLVQPLVDKGVPLGTALAFMMSVIALSLPEMVILRKVLRPQLIAIFVGVVAGGIMLVGYLLNAVLPGIGR
jgi:uncharacterized membrane protein YraQ (UPF0718 family)